MGQWVQLGGVPVKPAEVIAVCALGVVIKGAVVPLKRPIMFKPLWKAYYFRYFIGGHTLVGIMESLIIDKAVGVTHHTQMVANGGVTPDGPAVTGVEYLCFISHKSSASWITFAQEAGFRVLAPRNV